MQVKKIVLEHWHLLLILMIGACAAVAHNHNFDLLIASRGETVLPWLYRLISPENFSRDYSGISELYSKTLTAYPFLFAYQLFGIAPEGLLPFFISAEIFVSGIAGVYLLKSIVKAPAPAVIVIVFCLMICGNFRYADFGKFGLPFFFGLYYSFADAFRLFALGLFFRGRFAVAAVLFSLSFMCHPILAINGIIFATLFSVANREKIFRKENAKEIGIGVCLTVLICGLWVFAKYPGSDLQTSIPLTSWFQISEMASSHWYPVTLGVFGERQWEIAIPFFSFLLLFLYSLQRSADTRARALACTMFGVIVVVGIGVLLSVLKVSPTLTKLALQRSNDVLLSVGLVLIVNALWQDIVGRNFLKRCFALLILIAPLMHYVVAPLFAVLPFAVLIFLNSHPDQQTDRIIKYSAAAVIVSLVVFLAVLVGMHIPVDWNERAYLGTAELWKEWGVVVCILAAVTLLKLDRRIVEGGVVLSILFMTGVLLQHVYNKNPYSVAEPKLAQDYKEVQFWARETTSPNALFMPDPELNYGWRDYSRRSSFGTPREWLFTGWQYSSSAMVFAAGQARIKEFVSDLTPFIAEGRKGYAKLASVIIAKCYEGDSEWAKRFAAKYEIDYLVLQKGRLKKPYAFPVAFENTNYVVYESSPAPGVADAG